MIVIENLDVRLEVEGDGDEAHFARLFAKCIRAWSRSARESLEQRRKAEADRSLGDRPTETAGGDFLV